MYRKWVKIALIAVYLVIIAGAMVRMTGSGMGCPDWPKCFGYYVPPTDVTELEWQPQRSFKKGQVIIKDETLQVAAKDFKTGEAFSENNWNLYTKHDYATFNVWHTWIEYVNRLFGALSGIAVFIMALFSFSQWKYSKRITLLSWVSVFLLGFQAWLGATVVYSVLSPIRITIHMVMALVILAVLLYLLYYSRPKLRTFSISRGYINLLIFALILTIIQVVTGTQVRQFIDEQIDIVGYQAKSLWLDNPDIYFYIHRSFSILIFLVNLALWFFNKKHSYGLRKINMVFFLVILEAATGIGMYYFDFPFLSQPLHLVIASLLFGYQSYVVLQAWKRHRPDFITRQV